MVGRRSGDEEREPRILKDLGRPTSEEVEHHNVAHLTCLGLVALMCDRKGQGPHASWAGGLSSQRILETVFDYCFLGAEGEARTVLALVALDRRAQMLFGHVVPRRGLSRERGTCQLHASMGLES